MLCNGGKKIRGKTRRKKKKKKGGFQWNPEVLCWSGADGERTVMWFRRYFLLQSFFSFISLHTKKKKKLPV